MKSKLAKSVLFLILSLIFFSCSSSSGSQDSFILEESLKDISDRRDEELTWTRELESVRLIRDIKKTAYISPSIKLNPQLMTVAVTEKEPVYPFLEGFGSLDTTEITSELRAFLNPFCEKMSQWKFDASDFEEGSIYSAVLFKYDVESLWNKAFSEKLASSENEEKIFSGYVYGEPYIDQDQIEVPVRFVFSKGNLDIKLYVSQSDSFKINQIDLCAFTQE